MLIDDADKPAKWYFALKQARLKGTGDHPLSGPVTLHWRRLRVDSPLLSKLRKVLAECECKSGLGGCVLQELCRASGQNNASVE